MFRISTLGGFLLLATIAVSINAEEPAEKKLAELKWAKEVASDFLDAAFAGKLEQAEALLDASLKASFTAQGENRLSEHLNNNIAIRGFHSPMFRSEAMAPDQDEASFKG